MRSSFIRPAKWTVLLLIVVFLSDYSYAVSKEEWQQLNLFYGEEDLVITSTRHPKHISQIPENMEVITSEEIEKLNVHTIAEVLERVTGVFVDSRNQDFGSNCAIKIQGSGTQMHVKVMVDGISFNNHSEGYPSVLNIPLGIIERVEIIKGPASSTWGSSLGGVINIITKSPVKDKPYSGKIQSSYGKENSQDHKLDFSGTKDFIGYYLFGNYQESDGLVDTRSYENQNYFTKFVLTPFKSTEITLSSGLSFPEIDDGHSDGEDSDPYKIPTHWFSGNLTTSIGDITLKFDVSEIRQKSVFYTVDKDTREVTKRKEYDEEIFMLKGQGTYEYGENTLVIGCDFIFPASMDYEATSSVDRHNEVDKTAFYINNTFNIGNFTFVPGIRYDIYDYLKIDTREFISPSIGAVYRLNNDTVYRATIAKGFNEVPFEWMRDDVSWGNPDVKNEEVTSCQIGFETRSVPYIWIKTSLFYNYLENKIDTNTEHNVENIGDVEIWGYEFEVRTLKIKNFMFSTGFSFSRSEYDLNNYYLITESYEQIEPVNRYMCNLGVVYEISEPYKGSDFLRIALLGKYIYWDTDSDVHEHDTIWNIGISKRLNYEDYSFEVFVKANNIFNGKMYVDDENNVNPKSWMECGIKLFF